MIWLQIPWELCWAIFSQSSCVQRSRQQKRETEKYIYWQPCPFRSCSLFTLFCLQCSGTEFCKKICRNILTNCSLASIILKLSRNAAIAQPVERILGKDEVASSNLASSSKKEPIPSGIGSFFMADAWFEKLNLTCRWHVRVYQFKNWYTTILWQIWLAAPASIDNNSSFC